jgi:alanine-synthesizing transaminase
MKRIDQSTKLQNVLYEIRGPVAARAAELEREGHSVLKLNIGNPQPFDFHSPQRIVSEINKKLPQINGYSESKGLQEAREAVVRRYRAQEGFPPFDADDVFLGNGVSELITMTLQALLNDGDEVLIPSPDYPLWTAMTSLGGGRPVHYSCLESDNWAPDIADLEAKITSKTKAIVVINPNNPTGAVYTRRTLEHIASLARKHGLLLLADEIYDTILYDNVEHISLAEVAPDVLCLTFNGLSKSACIAGYRSAWMVITGDTRDAQGFIHGLELLASTRLCPNVPGQVALQAGLQLMHEEHDENTNLSYSAKEGRLAEQRDLAVSMLNDMEGISCVAPQGALYAFPCLDPEVHAIHSDEKLVMDLLNSEHILLVHGSGFSWPTTDHLRVVLLPRKEVLNTAFERMGNFLAGYRQ